MKRWFSLLGFLFLWNVNYSYGQESDLLLKMTQLDNNKLTLQCNLVNISNEAIEIDHFLTSGNAIVIERPDGIINSIGSIVCGTKKKGMKINAHTFLTWEVNINHMYFDPPFVIRPKKNGTYKFYWLVNGIKSDPIVYEYISKK